MGRERARERERERNRKREKKRKREAIGQHEACVRARQQGQETAKESEMQREV